ncbi:MAG: hypothetical protein SOZ45_05825 [Ruminococcus sp.]|nr:hypothetical protein [Ruminococcus sp.]
MARVIDITDKLNFEERPKLKVKGKEYEVNDSAVTMLKIMPKLKGNVTPDVVNELFEFLFAEKDRAEIEKLSLNFKDFSTLVMEAVKLVAGDEEPEGETVTPDMT